MPWAPWGDAIDPVFCPRRHHHHGWPPTNVQQSAATCSRTTSCGRRGGRGGHSLYPYIVAWPLTSAARSPTTSIRRRSLLLDGWTLLILSSNLTDLLQPSLNPSLVCLWQIEQLNRLRVHSIKCMRAIITCGILLQNIGSIAYLCSAPGTGRGGLCWTLTSYGPKTWDLNFITCKLTYTNKIFVMFVIL